MPRRVANRYNLRMSRERRSIRPSQKPRPGIATTAARGVRADDDKSRGRPASEPLVLTSVFEFPSIEASEPALRGEAGYVYARYGMPNGRSLEHTVARLEGGEDALATSSGMAAILCAVLACTKAGDRVLCQADAYGGTRSLFERDLVRAGLEVRYVDAYDPAKVGDALAQGARCVMVESLSNPLVREVDVSALSWHCRTYGAHLCVDNTFATPVFRRPLSQGADVIVHSATKFLGGHHDLCAGVMVGPTALVHEARGIALRMGCLVSPFEAWLASRGIKTLDVRMQRSDENARELAARLSQHPRIRALHYPGWGAMLSFDVGSREAAEQVVTRSANIPLTPSLGGTETAFSHSATSSHRGVPQEEREALGIGDGLLRLSVGIEDIEDLWSELSQALDFA
jgi:cystathionine beta-lyase/cystathionine gamma-synthase